MFIKIDSSYRLYQGASFYVDPYDIERIQVSEVFDAAAGVNDLAKNIYDRFRTNYRLFTSINPNIIRLSILCSESAEGPWSRAHKDNEARAVYAEAYEKAAKSIDRYLFRRNRPIVSSILTTARLMPRADI